MVTQDGGGLRFNEGKPRYAFIPTDAMQEVAKVFTKGAEKYEPRNWERGMAWSICFDSLCRHLFKWWSGEDFDKESGLHHLAHVVANGLFLLSYALRGMKSLDDREHLDQRVQNVESKQ